MIVSFRHQFIFTAIPKTATHAFRNALRPHLAENDWEQCVLFEKKYFPVKPLAEIGHGHLTLQQLKPFILPSMFQNYFKFCVVRDPLRRFVSYCRFINRDNQKMQTDALGTMKRIISDGKARGEILFRPQHEFIVDAEGKLLVDFVCRFENLQNDFNQVFKQLDLPLADLQKINDSDSAKYRNACDNELKLMVEKFYRKDSELFDYPINSLDKH